MRKKKRNGSRGGMMRRRTAHLVRSAKILGRPAKQLLMVLADTVAMPVALWTALMLHTGTVNSHFEDHYLLYAASVVFTLPVFVRLGLYRAVIRFLGIQATLAIAAGVTVSTIALVVINNLFLAPQVPLAVFAIYFALAILYVGASRFGAREFVRMGNFAAAPVVIYGAGAAGAQLCASLLTSQHFRPVAFVDDNVKSHGARVMWTASIRAGQPRRTAPPPRCQSRLPGLAERVAPPTKCHPRRPECPRIQGSNRPRHQ